MFRSPFYQIYGWDLAVPVMPNPALHISLPPFELSFYFHLNIKPGMRIITPWPSTANGCSFTWAPFRFNGQYVNFFEGSESLFNDPAITTRPFSVLWPHLHGIVKHFLIGYPSFHYSSPNTLNFGILNGCVTKKVSQLWWHR